MSLPDQEARALDEVWDFMLALGSGEYRVTRASELRAEARRVMKHWPLAAGSRWLEFNGEEQGR